MLLDSAGDVIRLFQAYDRDASFCLPARGGFLVTAQQQNRQITFLKVQSQRGEICRVRLPWDQVCVKNQKDELIDHKMENSILAFSTQAGDTYKIFQPDNEKAFVAFSIPEAAVRESGEATLGLFKRM